MHCIIMQVSGFMTDFGLGNVDIDIFGLIEDDFTLYKQQAAKFD